MSTTAIILAGGHGSRFDSVLPKQFMRLAGKPIIQHTVEIFQKNKNISSIVVVAHKDYLERTIELLPQKSFGKLVKVIEGGASRQQSSFEGLKNCPEGTKKVLIHDAVRPFTSNRIIDECVDKLNSYNSIDVAINSADTIIEVDKDNIITQIPDRSTLRRGQTPQAFNFQTILSAHQKVEKIKDFNFTDDCGLIKDHTEEKTFVVNGDTKNIKITFPEDLVLADKLIQMKSIEVNDELNKVEGQLKNKVLIVFGGSRGIGAEILKLADNFGMNTISLSRKNNCDIGDHESVKAHLQAIYKEYGQIDHIVNTAAVLKLKRFEDKSFEEIRSEINVNLIGNLNIAKLSLPYLKNTSGSLTFFASSSYTRGRPMYSLYSSAKAAIVNFSQALAEEYAPQNVRVNIINPERSKTPMRKENFGDEPESSLLSPWASAVVTLKTIASDISGQVVSVKKNNH